jgi:hypothetical protein
VAGRRHEERPHQADLFSVAPDDRRCTEAVATGLSIDTVSHGLLSRRARHGTRIESEHVQRAQVLELPLGEGVRACILGMAAPPDGTASQSWGLSRST